MDMTEKYGEKTERQSSIVLEAIWKSGELIVGAVWTNPIPKDAVGIVFAEGSIVETDASRPNFAHFLEADRRVAGVGFEKLKVFVRELANGLRQLSMVEPKLRCRKVVQSGVQRPAS